MNNKEFIIGKLTEKEFAKLFEGAKVSSKHEDMYDHWDIEIPIKVDVKTISKNSRSDVTYNENFHWVELTNVRGDKGWVDGLADYIAFENEDYWVIVDRVVLREFILSKTHGKTVGSNKEFYHLYQRKSRKDVVVKAKTIDLIYIAVKMLKKEADGKSNNQQS